MAYNPLNPNGQAAMAASQPVVIASNQTPVSVAGTINIGTSPGSVAAWLQSTNASVITVGTAAANQSVSGAVSIDGTVTVKSSIAGGIFPISGSVAAVVTNFPTTQNVSGSVAAWLQSGNASIITVGTAAANQSVSGTVGVTQAGTWIASVFGNFSVIGTVPVTQSTNPWTVVSSIAGGIFPVSGSVAAVITNTTVAISGSVAAFQAGTNITSLVSTVPSSVIVGTSIFGQLPAGTAPIGSVATLQGTNPWIVNFQNSSIITVSAGSILAALSSPSVITVWSSPSIVGTYAEDSAHATADKGIFVLGVRNDAVASFAAANLEYGPQATDSAGRILTKPFSAEESRVEGYNSVVSGSVTTLVAAAGTGLKNYITDIVLVNTGAATTLVTFRSGGGTSVLGYGIAPTGGGSNMIGFAMPLKTLANETFDFQATTSTSILFATVKGFKAP